MALVSAAPNSTSPHGNIQREPIRVVLKDTLRLHGIPSGWLACEVIVIARSASEEDLHIQLVVSKWNEQLLRYAPVLQQQLLLGLDRFDPSVDHSRYIVSWRFSPDCGCPFTRMPEPTLWLQDTLPQPDEEPVPVLDRRHTRRPPKAPKGNAPPSAPKKRPPSFDPTQIAPLR